MYNLSCIAGTLGARPSSKVKGLVTNYEVQKQVRLHALYDMAVQLSELRSLESVLNTALDHCLVLTESEFGFIWR